MKTHLFARLLCPFLVVAISQPLLANTAGPIEVHYHMITETVPGHREVRFAVALKLSPNSINGNEIGWQLDEVALRQPQLPSACPRTWSTAVPIVKTTDNLWWISHIDTANPVAVEFDVPPWIEGTAISTEPAKYDDLIFDFEGVPGTHATGRVKLNYTFQLVGASEPEELDDDDDEEDTEGPDLPSDPPDWPDFDLQISPYDLNQDGTTDGLDIEPFITRALSGCDYDITEDGPCFVKLLLGETCSTQVSDCNSNGIADEADILLGGSDDCNGNGVPDDCDLSANTSSDLNSDGIPDECNADCNGNGIPDDKDLADGTSNDVNNNAIPDECDPDCNSNRQPDDTDISSSTSFDCNGDGVPDECGYDCNANGIADVCDIDPLDPDGDGLVASDCNADGFPDSCNLTLPAPFTSFDCNANGIPDECDIAECQADPLCQDCNMNGVPDSCDISSGASQDANSNSIPDTCESQQMNGSGGAGSSMLMAGPVLSPSPEADPNQGDKQLDLLDWAIHEDWGNGSESGAIQFNRYVEKCNELGLDVVAMNLIF